MAPARSERGDLLEGKKLKRPEPGDLALLLELTCCKGVVGGEACLPGRGAVCAPSASKSCDAERTEAVVDSENRVVCTTCACLWTCWCNERPMWVQRMYHGPLID